MESRAQVAYHFKIDPAKLIPGAVRIPETITRTIVVGDELQTDKVSSSTLSPSDRAALIIEIEKLTSEANRVAKPAEEAPPAETTDPMATAAATDDEMTAF